MPLFTLHGYSPAARRGRQEEHGKRRAKQLSLTKEVNGVDIQQIDLTVFHCCHTLIRQYLFMLLEALKQSSLMKFTRYH